MPPAILPPLDPARVREIASLLEDRPASLMAAGQNRSIWNRFAQTEPLVTDRILALAREFIDQPPPVLTDAMYLESRRTGGRFGYPELADQRRTRLTLFTLAEGLENRGHFFPAVNREIAAICAERVWVSPPHDWNRLNFEGIRIDNDLISAMTAWSLASADTILGAGLEPEVRQAIRGRIRQTVTGPYLSAIRGLREEEWWTRNPNNWNPVVHSGIIGAALLLDDYSTGERAEMIAAAERDLQGYLDGFPADGYSPEGMGYWRYGFGHYALLAEAVLVATRGRLSLYASERARLVAQFPERFELIPSTHFYPPFSDARFPEPPAPWLSYFLDQRFGLGGVPRVFVPEGDFTTGFFSTFLHAWHVILNFDPDLVAPWRGSGVAFSPGRLRDWFEESQILIARLRGKNPNGLNIAIKGGNNGTSHCHNDLGTFLVAVGDAPLMVDPGLTDYGPGTFGPDRFQNQIMGSYGHPVPLVAGQWQGTGGSFHAVVAECNFTAATDRLTLDLTPAYPVSALKNLTRRFEYSRAEKGALTVSDSVEFNSPQPFGTALVTYGEAREESPGVWIISGHGHSVKVRIDTAGTPFTVVDEILRDEARAGKVRRLGINFQVPAMRGTITTLISPYS